MAGKASTKPKPRQVDLKKPDDDAPKYEKIPTLKEMAVVFLITSVFAASLRSPWRPLRTTSWHLVSLSPLNRCPSLSQASPSVFTLK